MGASSACLHCFFDISSLRVQSCVLFTVHGMWCVQEKESAHGIRGVRRGKKAHIVYMICAGERKRAWCAWCTQGKESAHGVQHLRRG